MADVYQKNLAVASHWEAVVRLAEAKIAAGWTIHRSSDGTTADATDRWTGNFGSLGASSWIILNGPGGRQILFARSASSTTDGWIRYERLGTYDTAGTPTVPDASATEQDVRGTKGGAAVNWLGRVITPTQAQIVADDPANGGAWIIVTQPTGAPDGGTHLAFAELEDGEAGDVDPYAFWAPAATGVWSSLFNSHQLLLHETDRFLAWNADGTTFKSWGAGAPYHGYNSGSNVWGGDGSAKWRGASAIDQTVGGDWRLWKIRPMNDTDADVKGRTIRFGVVSSVAGGTSGRTFASGTFAKIGSFMWIPWDSAGTPPGTPP